MTGTIHLVWTLGERLSKARRTRGITPEDMAKRLGVSTKTIGNIEHDRVPIKRAYVLGYHLATGVPLEELEGDDGPDDGGDFRSAKSRCTGRSPLQIATLTSINKIEHPLQKVAAA